MTRPRARFSSAAASAGARRTAHQVRIIGGSWKRTVLPVLDLEGLRPTPDRVRETLFNWLGQRLDGMTCLDLFAGSGALGFEAASRGAARVLMVERDPRAAGQLRETCARLDAQDVEVVEGDALRIAATLPRGAFNIVFLDPPFGAGLHGGALALAVPLVSDGGLLYVESAMPLADRREPRRRLLRKPHAKSSSRLAGAVDMRDARLAGAAESVAEIPTGWRIVRQGRAGAVHHHLLHRQDQE